MKKNEEYIVEIVDNGFKGEGIAKIGDIVVFIPNAIKGENIKINEAFISDFECKYKLSFIRKYKLGEVLQRVGHSGFCDYRLVRFDLEKLAEYDREGVKKFLAEQEGGHA